jgi:predicted RNase H-related nuclease YkuK (DUF458 family)
MFTQTQIEEMVDLLATLDPNTKVYLGCDSVRVRKNKRNYARFATVAIVHMNGKNGCRIFSTVDWEPDYDVKKDRPKMRMLNEVRRVSELAIQLLPFIDEFDVEIHLDISMDPKNGSNCAAQEAAGYVLGMTGIEPKLKPNAFAASFGSDYIVNKSLK